MFSQNSDWQRVCAWGGVGVNIHYSICYLERRWPGTVSDRNIWKSKILSRQDVYNNSGPDGCVHCPSLRLCTPVLCLLSPPLRHPPRPLLHHPLILFPPLLNQCLLESFLSARSRMVPHLPARAICWRVRWTAALCHLDLPPDLVVSLLLFLSSSCFGSSLSAFIFDVSPPPPAIFNPLQVCSLLFSGLLHICAADPARFSSSPSPQPFHPSASRFVTR